MLKNHNIEILYSTEILEKKIVELAEMVERDYKDGVHIIGVLNGSFIFLADLCRNIKNVPVTIDFLGKSSYHFGTVSSGTVETTFKLKLPIEGKDVLVVEDIVDTGNTLSSTMAELKTMRPNTLKLMTLLNKPERREVEVKIDYCGFDIADKFVVGYGLDADEKYRNLPYIGVIQE